MAQGPWWRRTGAARVDESRWIVVDTETTGLDPATNELIAIAAIAMRIDWVARRAVITPGDSFEAVLRRDRAAADQANILLHGIGVQQQAEGVPPAEALAGFAAFVGDSPLLAFHAAFDQKVLQLAQQAHRCAGLRNRWADIGLLCAAASGEIEGRTLDDWMEHFGLVCARRHQAAADAMVEADVLLRIWPALARECSHWGDVERLLRGRRWLKEQRGR